MPTKQENRSSIFMIFCFLIRIFLYVETKKKLLDGVIILKKYIFPCFCLQNEIVGIYNTSQYVNKTIKAKAY